MRWVWSCRHERRVRTCDVLCPPWSAKPCLTCILASCLQSRYRSASAGDRNPGHVHHHSPPCDTLEYRSHPHMTNDMNVLFAHAASAAQLEHNAHVHHQRTPCPSRRHDHHPRRGAISPLYESRATAAAGTPPRQRLQRAVDRLQVTGQVSAGAGRCRTRLTSNPKSAPSPEPAS